MVSGRGRRILTAGYVGAGVIGGGGTPTLNSLAVTPNSATVGAAFSGNVSGRTAGSTLALSGAGSAGLAINSSTGAITGTPTNSGTVDVVETLAGAIGSPRTSSAALSVAAAALPTPTQLLMSNRLNPPGYGGYGNSSGTDTDSNTRISLYNETGAAVTKLRGYWANWRAGVNGEVAGSNAITIKAAIEYPAGTFQQFTFGGSASGTLAIDETKESDELTLNTPIPAGAQYWVRTYVAVTSGQFWPLAYLLNTAKGEAADFATGVDLSTSGTITNATASATRRGYGPLGVKATGFSGTPVKRAFASIGDSILMQAGDGNYDARGSGGWNGRSLSGKFPHVNFAITGSSVQMNLPAAYTRRLAALAMIGVTDIICSWSHNDIAAGRTLAQIQADLQASWNAWNSAAFRVHQTTSLPRVTGTFLTAAGQTVTATGGFTGGTSSIRHLVNAWLRSKPTPLAGVIEISDAVDVNAGNVLTSGGGYWLSGNGGVGASNSHLTATGAATDSATSDGTHPSVTNTTTPFYGGHYILKDVLDAYLTGLPT